jgi:chromosomal replication initiation ATPase DnaA
LTDWRQLPLALSHAPSLEGDDFLVASCNAAAVRWIGRWPEWPAPALVLFGPPGCGKTHLVHAFLSRSRGMLVHEGALASELAIDMAARAAACAVDDADRAIANGYDTPLLHLYNVLSEAGRHLLLTAEAPPSRWDTSLADLRSRLNAAPSACIGSPDDEMIAGVLVKQFADRRLKVDDGVILYALPRIERSFEAARRLVADLDAAALGARRKITISLVREVLRAGGEMP